MKLVHGIKRGKQVIDYRFLYETCLLYNQLKEKEIIIEISDNTLRVVRIYNDKMDTLITPRRVHD